MPGVLLTVRSQETAVETLRRAVGADRVHHAYLFEGPEGVGKQRAALGLAQSLVCERRAVGSPDACGECRPCVRAIPKPGETTPIHPDVVILARGLYQPATIGRRTPETQEISIDQVRTLVLARAAFPPHEGRAKIFIIRRAEELSVSAANALLKTLEEPGARTHFVLLSSAPDSLPLTIQSRTQRVRFHALPERVVEELLVERGVLPSQATTIARLAGGSMETAATLNDPGASQERQAFVARAMAALDERSLAGALGVAEDAKKMTKDTLVLRLQTFAAEVASEGRAAVAAGDPKATTASARYGLVLAAITQIESNASVQLAVETMFIKMRAA